MHFIYRKVNFDLLKYLKYHNNYVCTLEFYFMYSIKLLKVSDLYKTVHEDVNGLLSENQLDYICKVLSNTGKVCIHLVIPIIYVALCTRKIFLILMVCCVCHVTWLLSKVRTQTKKCVRDNFQ